jgi:hypothetical protein
MRRCVRVEIYDCEEGTPLRSNPQPGSLPAGAVPSDNCTTMQKGSFVLKYFNLDFVDDWSLCPPPWGALSRKTPHCSFLEASASCLDTGTRVILLRAVSTSCALPARSLCPDFASWSCIPNPSTVLLGGSLRMPSLYGLSLGVPFVIMQDSARFN